MWLHSIWISINYPADWYPSQTKAILCMHHFLGSFVSWSFYLCLSFCVLFYKLCFYKSLWQNSFTLCFNCNVLQTATFENCKLLLNQIILVNGVSWRKSLKVTKGLSLQILLLAIWVFNRACLSDLDLITLIKCAKAESSSSWTPVPHKIT